MEFNNTSRSGRGVKVVSERRPSDRIDPITPEQRAAAARIRVAYDKKRGHKTEGWIKKLAKSA